MQLYLYDGPVMKFETVIQDRWRTSTYAVSEKKAKTNLCFRYKMLHDMPADAKLDLPGKFVSLRKEKRK